MTDQRDDDRPLIDWEDEGTWEQEPPPRGRHEEPAPRRRTRREPAQDDPTRYVDEHGEVWSEGDVDDHYGDEYVYGEEVYYEDDAAYDAGRWVEWGGPASRFRRILVSLVVVAGTLAVIAGAGYLWVQRQIDPPGEPGEPVDVEIATGATTESIGRTLDDSGVIANSSVWNYWTRFNDVGPFQAGFYTFQTNMSFDEAIEILDAGPRPVQSERITIPEGLTIAEIGDRLTDPEQGFDRWDPAAIDSAINGGLVRSAYQPAEVTSLEGLLFPNTYEVAEDATELEFVQRLVTQMDDVLREIDAPGRAPIFNLTPYEVVVIASLIEEEARVEQDRAKISRVIHNRLVQGIPLGIDATSAYEAELEGRDRTDLDFSTDSPYNTRRVQGLPPTPIAAPGRASLEAALAPADGPWIFYVLANEQGEHFFTDSNEEFLAAKERCAQAGLGCG